MSITWLIIFLALNLADVALTLIGLHLGARELNRLYSFAIEATGSPALGLLAIKILVGGPVVFIAAMNWPVSLGWGYDPATAFMNTRDLLPIGSVAMLGVCLWNAVQVRKQAKNVQRRS